MGVLTKNRILEEIKKGNIKIKPFNKKYIGPASIDLHLSNQFRTFKESKNPIKITEKTDYKKYSKLIKAKSIVINPGQHILGITKENITLSDELCARLEGRSRFARLGLLVHITASFVQPGINNKQVLEIFNASKSPLKIEEGTRICQIIIERTEGKAKYKGKFKKQRSL